MILWLHLKNEPSWTRMGKLAFQACSWIILKSCLLLFSLTFFLKFGKCISRGWKCGSSYHGNQLPHVYMWSWTTERKDEEGNRDYGIKTSTFIFWNRNFCAGFVKDELLWSPFAGIMTVSWFIHTWVVHKHKSNIFSINYSMAFHQTWKEWSLDRPIPKLLDLFIM